MTVVSIELNGDEAKCFSEYHCFAHLFSDPHEIPVNHPVKTFFNGEDQEDAVVVAIQEVHMRVESGDVVNGFLFIFVSEMEVETVDHGSTMIIQPEAVESYQKYGYFVLPFVGEGDLPIGGVMELTNAGLDLESGIIVAVQKFLPTWHYLFIIAKPPE